MTKTTDLEIVSSIWILASNDESCIITYKSIIYRLGLPDDYDVKGLIKIHGELFRQKASQKALDDWKSQMLHGHYLPSWIKEIRNDFERGQAITNLKVDDLFRSQFRAKAGTPPSDISIINWGLEHIERLRKSAIEKNDEKRKVITNLWVPIISMLISLTAIIASCFIQKEAMENQKGLKTLELEYGTKQKGYTAFMKSVVRSYVFSANKNRESLVNSLDDLEASYYDIEHLLKKEEQQFMWNQIGEFSHLCLSNISISYSDSAFADSCYRYKKDFRNKLQNSLFPKTK